MKLIHCIKVLGFASAALAVTGCASIDDVDDTVASEDALGVGSYYSFRALAGSGKCLDVAGNRNADGTNIQEWTCNGSGAQLFRSELVGGQVRLVNASSGKCVDVKGAGTANGTNIQLYTCNGTAAQAFRIDDAGNGNVRIVNTKSSKCVDVAAAGTADGTNVQLYTCNGTAAQLWHPTVQKDPIKIMPLGASITWGVGGTNAGYREPLDNLLNQHGIAHEFVGSSTENPGHLSENQRHHEGHPGFVITAGTSGRSGITDNLRTWLGPPGADPDYILLLVGSNDVSLNYKFSEVGDRMDALISTISNKATGLRPDAHLIVATLPMINDATEEARAKMYNATITAVAERHKAAGESVSVADVHAVVTAADKTDNLHPNDSGYNKIANVWYDAIVGR